MSNPLVVNFFAGPGSGKSTMASGLFYNLKNLGVNAELAGEFAKDLVWSGRQRTLEDQIYVFGKQHHRLFRLKDDVDVIITDSPLLMSLAYTEHYPESFKETVHWAFNQYNNINIFINRVKPYNPKGRNQDLNGAMDKDEEIRDLLTHYKVPCWYADGNDHGLEEITSTVMEKIQG